MSSFILLNDDILKSINTNLIIRDKFTFSLVNKKFYNIFYNYPLLNTIYQIADNDTCCRMTFLVNNVVNIYVKSIRVDYDLIEMFENLQDLDLSRIEFCNFSQVKRLVHHLPEGLSNVTISNYDIKELFTLASNFHSRTFSISVNRKRLLENDGNINVTKRVRVPSPIVGSLIDEVESFNLFKSRLKYSCASPADFIPSIISQKFPEIRTDYKTIVDMVLFVKDLEKAIATSTVEDAIKKCSELLIHSIVRSQEGNWVFVTQIEAYYHRKEIDDVAQVRREKKYPKTLVADFKEREEGKSSWCELRFRFEKLEVGGFSWGRCTLQDGRRYKTDLVLACRSCRQRFFSKNAEKLQKEG
ncbi:hypothetical protein MFLAVUS_009477 [Mucor flavus]|uniref:F-box domain-containing protein n=1 Tax=Mucor flavus TaxID=439312 RepID=A0ABP9ZA04_9FUNG